MDVRISAILIASLAAVLLLAGCLGGTRGQAVQPPASEQPSIPGTQQSGGSLGDADISGPQSEDEATLPAEDLVPPPMDVPGESTSQVPELDDADIDLGAIEEDYVISDEDIVEPA